MRRDLFPDRADLPLARAELPLARLSSFRSHNLLLAAFSLALGSVRTANANAELRIPRQLDQPTRATPPRAVRFFARKEAGQVCRDPHLLSAALLRIAFCERSSRGHARFAKRLRTFATKMSSPSQSEGVHRSQPGMARQIP